MFLILLRYRLMGRVDSDVKYSKTSGTDKEVVYWSCSSRCILDTKVIFEGDVTDMRKSLAELDRCPHEHTYKQEWHYQLEPSVGDTDSTDPRVCLITVMMSLKQTPVMRRMVTVQSRDWAIH